MANVRARCCVGHWYAGAHCAMRGETRTRANLAVLRVCDAASTARYVVAARLSDDADAAVVDLSVVIPEELERATPRAGSAAGLRTAITRTWSTARVGRRALDAEVSAKRHETMIDKDRVALTEPQRRAMMDRTQGARSRKSAKTRTARFDEMQLPACRSPRSTAQNPRATLRVTDRTARSYSRCAAAQLASSTRARARRMHHTQVEYRARVRRLTKFMSPGRKHETQDAGRHAEALRICIDGSDRRGLLVKSRPRLRERRCAAGGDWTPALNDFVASSALLEAACACS
jgi:hypothetical protein